MKLILCLWLLSFSMVINCHIHRYPAGPDMGFSLATASQNEFPDETTWKIEYQRTHPGVDFGSSSFSSSSFTSTSFGPPPKQPTNGYYVWTSSDGSPPVISQLPQVSPGGNFHYEIVQTG